MATAKDLRKISRKSSNQEISSNKAKVLKIKTHKLIFGAAASPTNI